MTERERDCEPPPHDLLHDDQAEKADVAQCTGQGPWSHAADSCSSDSSHTAPPAAAGLVTVRVRCFVPTEPHDFEQAPHGAQSEYSQSSGQACVLHATSFELGPHASPPKLGATSCERVSVYNPVPQLTLHVVEPVQPDCWQSTGHSWTLQAIDMLVGAGQTAPPNDGAVIEARARLAVPAPHDLVHVLQLDQSASSPRTLR